MKRQISLFLVVALLLTTLFGCIPNPAPETWGELETPTENSTLNKMSTIKGWCFSSYGINKVQFLVDGTLVGEQASFNSRSDITAKYQEQINNGIKTKALAVSNQTIQEAKFGFEYSLNTSKYSNGTHSLTVKAISSQKSVIIKTLNITISNTLPVLIAPNGTIKGTIPEEFGEVWYKVILPESGNLSVNLTDMPTNHIYKLGLFDVNLTPVATEYSQIDKTINLNYAADVGTYYIKVYSLFGYDTSKYYSLSTKFVNKSELSNNEISTGDMQKVQ